MERWREENRVGSVVTTSLNTFLSLSLSLSPPFMLPQHSLVSLHGSLHLLPSSFPSHTPQHALFSSSFSSIFASSFFSIALFIFLNLLQHIPNFLLLTISLCSLFIPSHPIPSHPIPFHPIPSTSLSLSPTGRVMRKPHVK